MISIMTCTYAFDLIFTRTYNIYTRACISNMPIQYYI